MADQEKDLEQLEPKKADAPAKQPAKKQNFFARAGHSVAKWFRDLKSEAKKVVWPTGKQVSNNTVIVIIAIIVVAIFVAVLDVTFGFLRNLIAQLV